ncbi:activating transcription factor 7-interacting protein 2 [Rhynchocyon petersi]
MASPNGINRKILKAKKTMPSSCRKQVELLNKSKTLEAQKIATVENNVPSSNQSLRTDIIPSKCRHTENDASLLSSSKNSVYSPKSKMLPQHLLEAVEKIVDSETRLEYVDDKVVSPYQKPGKTVCSIRNLFIDEAKESLKTSEKNFESQASMSRSSFDLHNGDCHVESICCSSNVLNGVTQIGEYVKVLTLDDKGEGKMVSCLETNSTSETNSTLEACDKNPSKGLHSDSYIQPIEKTSNFVKSVNSNICATDVDVLRTEESTDSTWNSSLHTDSPNQKKRMFSENKENVKRMKTSEQKNENISLVPEKQRTLLEQVTCLIRQEIFNINSSVFDNKLKELNDRIRKTQCKDKHEVIADELFAKIAKLQRRIKRALLQRNCLEPNTLRSNVACKAINPEATNLVKNQKSVNSSDGRMTSEKLNHSRTSEEANENVNLSQDHVEFVSESNDDVIFISVENPNLTTSVTSNPTATRRSISRNSNNIPDAEMDTTDIEKRKTDFVIDLTNEGQSNCNTESPPSSMESPSNTALNSKETTPGAQVAVTVQVPESFEHLPPLPEPPPLLPELVDKIRDTLPPQKPELKVKRVLKPRGIALTWNITKINPKCAPVESYHLFLCNDTPNNKLIWEKIGEIKALPLPMACTLSQFLASNKYYFTVQSKDIFGRYGPFCDIKCIPGFSENLT